MKVRIIYENIEGKWYASSPELIRWSAGADSLGEIKRLAHEGAHFVLERDHLEITEEFADSIILK
jgi:predicted RNase H-like HicB family nuclease